MGDGVNKSRFLSLFQKKTTQGILVKNDPTYERETDFRLKYIDYNGAQGEPSQPFWASENKAYADLQTIKQLFYSEDWVFATVDSIAQPISTLPIYVYKTEMINNEQVKTKVNAPILDKIFNSPNRFQTKSSFLYCMAADYILTGNAYAWKSEAGGLYHIPSENVLYNFGKDGLPNGYLVMTDSEDGLPTVRHSVPLQSMAHSKRPNPSSAIYGLSPFVPGRRSVLFNRYSAEYLNNFYLKGASPQFILELPEKTSASAITKLLASFEAAYVGRRNQRRTLVLPAGVKATPSETKIADQQLKDLIMMNRENILAVLKVPKHVLGIQTSGSLGSEEHKSALKYFWQTTVTDTAISITQSLSKAFFPNGEYTLEFDFTNVPELQDDEMQKAILSKELLNVMTVNEIRKKIWKLEEVYGGDSIGDRAAIVNQPQQFDAQEPVDSTQVESQVAQQAVTTPEQSLKVAQVSSLLEIVSQVAQGFLPRETGIQIIRIAFALSPEDSQAVMGAVGLTFKPEQVEPVTQEQKSEPEIIHEFKNLLTFDFNDDHKKAIEKSSNETKKIEKESYAQRFSSATKLITKQIELAIDAVNPGQKADLSKKEIEKRLKKAFSEMETDYVNEADKDLIGVSELGYDKQVALVFDGEARDALIAVKEKDAKGRRKLLTDRNLFSFQSATKTNLDNIMYEVERGIKENMSILDVSKNIAQYMKDNLKWRADTIARTETLTAMSVGQQSVLKQAKESGIKKMKKVWVTAADERVRDGHQEAMGQTVDSEEPFIVSGEKLMYPRAAGGSAGNVINCRCDMLMVPSDEIGDYDQDIQDLQDQQQDAFGE